MTMCMGNIMKVLKLRSLRSIPYWPKKGGQLARKPGTITLTLFSMIGSSGTFGAPMWISRQSAKRCGAPQSHCKQARYRLVTVRRIGLKLGAERHRRENVR